MTTRLTVVCLSLLLLFTPATLLAAPYVQVQLPLDKLPDEHDYQKKLRAYLATLTEKDFEYQAKPVEYVEPKTPDDLYHLWLLTTLPPSLAGTNTPASAFTLPSIESKQGLVLPTAPSACQVYAWMAHWDYPGNPYHNVRALKLRAFVLAAIDLSMLDYLYEHNPQEADRADYLGGNLIWIGFTYGVVKDALPPEALAAFEDGIKKQAQRINHWGPKGLMTDMDLFAPVGLWYIQQAMHDPSVSKLAEDYARQLYTQPHYFNDAGYFVDNGCFDTSYNGISLYFSTWAALATDWPFARDAVVKAYRLRAYLRFPDPVGGGFSGPSEMSSRTSTNSAHDQWDFADRDYAQALLSDQEYDIAPLLPPQKMTAQIRQMLDQLSKEATAPAKLSDQPWKEGHWSRLINYAYEFYQPGYYARRLKLDEEHSPLLQPLFKRPDTFVREFGQAFVIARFPDYALALHTGPVGRSVGYNGCPYGFGGGQLATFWTPASGVVIDGRRRGVQGGANWDKYDEWRDWPNHCVSGLTSKNELVTSSRIQLPTIEPSVSSDRATIKASGNMPKYDPGHTATGPSGLQYERTFTLDAKGLRIQTQVTSDGSDSLAELYEIIPVLIAEDPVAPKPGQPRNPATTTILTHAGGSLWTELPPGKTTGITELKLARFGGSALITFDKPQTINVSDKPWHDGYQSQAQCRNIRIDLLAGQAAPATIKTVAVGYTITAGQPDIAGQ